MFECVVRLILKKEKKHTSPPLITPKIKEENPEVPKEAVMKELRELLERRKQNLGEK